MQGFKDLGTVAHLWGIRFILQWSEWLIRLRQLPVASGSQVDRSAYIL